MMYYYYRAPSPENSSSSNSTSEESSSSSDSSSSGTRYYPAYYAPSGYGLSSTWPASHVYHHHHYAHPPAAPAGYHNYHHYAYPPAAPTPSYFAYPGPITGCSWRGGSRTHYLAHAQSCHYPHYYEPEPQPFTYAHYPDYGAYPAHSAPREPTPPPPPSVADTSPTPPVQFDRFSYTPTHGSAEATTSSVDAVPASTPAATGPSTTPPAPPQPAHVIPTPLIPWSDFPPADFSLRPPPRQETRRTERPEEVMEKMKVETMEEVKAPTEETKAEVTLEVKAEVPLEEKAEKPLEEKREVLPESQKKEDVVVQESEGRVNGVSTPNWCDTMTNTPDCQTPPTPNPPSEPFPFCNALQRAIAEAASESAVATLPRPARTSRLGIQLLEASVQSSSLRRALLGACVDDELWSAVVSTARAAEHKDAPGLAGRLLHLAAERSDLGCALLASAATGPLGAEILAAAERCPDIAEAVRRLVRAYATGPQPDVESPLPSPLVSPLPSHCGETECNPDLEPRTPAPTVRFCMSPHKYCDPRAARVDDEKDGAGNDVQCCACAHRRTCFCDGYPSCCCARTGCNTTPVPIQPTPASL